MVKLTAIQGNSLKLDGGTMFGHVPKVLWSKWVTVDDLNKVKFSCRCLLAQDNGKNILFDAGTGAFLNPELKKRYGIENKHVLLESLAKVGLTHTDIDAIVISHLHFDHVGGVASEWQENQATTLLFPNAHFIVSEKDWERANNPHPRDKASFVPEINKLLAESGRLKVVTNADLLGNNFHFHISNGHTPGLISTEINTEQGPVIFTSDLIPGSHWVHLPITTNYDRYPELLIDEKEKLLKHAVKTNAQLFYVHDGDIALSKVQQNATGRFSANFSHNSVNTASSLL